MRFLTWLVLGSSLFSLTSRALAQSAETPATPAPAASSGVTSEDAREHFKRGEAAYDRGNYTLAVSEWQAAYGADPRPRIQYNIYQALERLGQLPEAADALQRYLSTADPDDPYYSDATARAASLQQRLASTGIRLVGGVEGGSINISGHDWGRLPRPDRIAVQPGNHRILITLPGYKDFVANVVVPPGQVVDVPVQLESIGGAAAPASGSASGSVDLGAAGSAKRDPTPFFIASGVLGAGAIGSAVWMITRISELSDCGEGDVFCRNESAVKTQRTIAIGVTAVLAAGAIGTLVYGLVVSGSNKEHAAMCVPGLGGAVCRVKF